MSKYKTSRPKNIDIQTEVCRVNGKVGIGVEENGTKLEKKQDLFLWIDTYKIYFRIACFDKRFHVYIIGLNFKFSLSVIAWEKRVFHNKPKAIISLFI